MDPQRELRQAILGVVGADPMPVDDILAALCDRGERVSRDQLDRLLGDDTAFTYVEDGVVQVPRLLEGTTWTAWIDAEQARDGFVRVHPHLEAMGWWLIGDDVDLVSETGQRRGPLEVDAMWLDGRDTDVVLGPEGWLAELAGGWASIRVAEGGLCWTACPTPPSPTEAQIEAMRVGFEAAVRTGSEIARLGRPAPPDPRQAGGDDPIHEALVADREAFVADPIPPLPALYEAAGLEQRDSTIAERGFDWDAYRAWQERNRLAAFYKLDEDQIDGVQLVLGACSTVLGDRVGALGATEDERRDTAKRLGSILDDGTLATVFWDESEGRGTRPDGLLRFIDTVSADLEAPLPVGLAWVRARALDLVGDAGTAAALLEQAVTSDCTHEPALIELAGFVADRGDAVGAEALLRRAGVLEADLDPDDGFDELSDGEQLLLEVLPFAHRPRPTVGRNDRCPCGSGRKYKQCHLGKERHPLEERAAWLYDKARRFLRRRAPDAVWDLADEVGDVADSPGVASHMRDSPWLVDVALHEGGAFADFLAARDQLLPDDEALLATQWSLVSRGVFEVQSVDRDRLELHDIGRGDDVTVVRTVPTARARTGVVLVGRPLPVGDTYRAFSGFIELSRARVNDFLVAIDEADAAGLAALVGELVRPPSLCNTDGEDLVFHTLRWTCPQPERVDTALCQAGLTPDGEDEWTLVRDGSNQPPTVIAHLTLVGNELTAEVNSDERADELRSLVGEVIPDAELAEDDVRSVDEALSDTGPLDLRAGPDLDDPAIAEVLREFIADAERRWLDESIPALGGRTPREAALDPIGREQLEHLLESFPPPGPHGLGVMDPERLRTALGL